MLETGVLSMSLLTLLHDGIQHSYTLSGYLLVDNSVMGHLCFKLQHLCTRWLALATIRKQLQKHNLLIFVSASRHSSFFCVCLQKSMLSAVILFSKLKVIFSECVNSPSVIIRMKIYSSPGEITDTLSLNKIIG